MSRKGGTRGGGWVHPKGENGVVQPWAIESPCSEPCRLVFCMNGDRKLPCHHVGSPFQATMAFFMLERVGIARANTR